MTNEEFNDDIVEGGDDEEGAAAPIIEYTPSLTEGEIEALGETATILRDNFDIEELKRVSQRRSTLKRCKTKSYGDEGLTHDRPEIPTDWHVQDRLDAAADVMLVANLTKLFEARYVPGVIYRGMSKGELRTVARTAGTDDYSIDPIGTQDLSYILSSAVCWKNGAGNHANVPTDVRHQLTALHLWYPVLKALSASPRWSRVGDRFNVASYVGYDRATASFITKDFDVTRKAKPTKAEVEAAVAFIMDLLAEFPFADDSSRTNAFALAITMALRNTWTTAPGFIVTAQAPESGKTLLVETLHSAVFGSIIIPAKMAYKEGDQDRRNLTSLFRDIDGDVVWWDEPRLSSDSTELGSPTLNLVLTAASGQYKDRPVYQRETLTLDVQKTLIISGNNLPLNPELARRSVVVSMRKDGTETYSRNEDELRDFALANQATFHQSLATIIDHWEANGSPKSTVTFGSYNSWMQIVGGIFDLLGITGLRQNTDTFVSPFNYAKADFALWVMANVKPIATGDGHVDITYTAIEKAMVDPANKAVLSRLTAEIFHHCPEKQEKVWSDMMDVVSGHKTKQVAQLISKAFRLIMIFDSIQGRDGKVAWMHRLKRSDNLRSGARIRFSQTPKVDMRGGNHGNQHTTTKPPRKRAARKAAPKTV